MGVSGSGKSKVAEELARQLNLEFIDGDDLHPEANINKMARGIPLNDEDRAPWLERIRCEISGFGHNDKGCVVVCSALKRRYREQLRTGNPGIVFVYLHGERAVILQRMQKRQGHFMQASMLDSQLAVLEVPGPEENDVIEIDVRPTLEEVVRQALAALSAQPEPGTAKVISG
ncbi:gluconokinase [Alteromonas aestuariivivens]|nr:gluconokinase [Alteromonas aestuariivivens]